MTADVRELVREDRFELLRRHARPARSPASSTTGRSHPMTVGTSTIADSQEPNRPRNVQAAARAGRRSAATPLAPATCRASAAAAPTSSPPAAAASGQPRPTARRGAATRTDVRFDVRRSSRGLSSLRRRAAGRRRAGAAGGVGRASCRTAASPTSPGSPRPNRRSRRSAASVIERHVCTRGHRRHRQHQRQADGGDDVADVGGAAAQREERDRREQPDERALPDELEQRPPDGLRRRLLKQDAQSRSSRTSRSLSFSPSLCRLCRPRASGESPPARPTTRACSRAPAGRASTTSRRRRGPSGRG